MRSRPFCSLLSATIAVTVTIACEKTRPARDPVAGTGKKNSSSDLARDQQGQMKQGQNVTGDSLNTDSSPATSPKIQTTSSECDTSIQFDDNEPVFLPDSKVFVTRIMSPCLGFGGKPGHRKNAGWMVMGFPCTGGEGRIDWKGTNYNKPKMVSFLLETSCPMGPVDRTKIQLEAFERLGIAKEANLVAFNPFVIQYWEIPEYGDADTTFVVDLRSNKGLDEGWANFIKPKPLRIFLVGRENAWVPGNFLYAVEGDLIWVNKNRFTFKVDKARNLKTAELQEIKSRCEALKPPRDCASVF